MPQIRPGSLDRIDTRQSTDDGKPQGPQRVGRPSVRDERRKQIVDSFIELVAVKGLEHVSLDEVAGKAGVQRAALRHFVGNRDELTAAAIIEMTRYALVDLNTAMSLSELTAMLFNPERMQSLEVGELAWNELMPEAMRSSSMRAVIKQCYDQLLQLISNALRQQYPNAARGQIAETAYAIACMAEYNYTFQRLGYPRARCNALRKAAMTLAAQLG